MGRHTVWAIFLAMTLFEADLASMMAGATFVLACTIVEFETTLLSFISLGLQERLGHQTLVLAVALPLTMLAAAFALTTECHAKICRAEEVSRSRQRHQEMLVDQFSRIPRIFQSFLQRGKLVITQLLVSSLTHLQFS